MFARPQGPNIEKMIASLPGLPTISTYERMKRMTGINMKNYDLVDKEKFHNQVVEFQYFAKKVLSQMKILKKAIQGFRNVKTTNIANVKIFQTLIGKYEDLNLSTYLNHNEKNLVFANPDYNRLSTQMEHMIENLKNPFEELYHWCKGEMYDLQALQESLAIVDSIDKKRKKFESKKNNKQEDLEKVNAGQKSIRTLFKNQTDSTAMQSTLESVSLSFSS